MEERGVCMRQQVLWVWFGEDVSDHDLNNWQLLRKLLQMRPADHQEIMEIESGAELARLEGQLLADGWVLDAAATHDTPRVTCWRKVSDED